MARERSAKPLYSGSNPLAASRKFKGLAQIELTPFCLRCPYRCLSSGTFSRQSLQLFLDDRVVTLEHVHSLGRLPPPENSRGRLIFEPAPFSATLLPLKTPGLTARRARRRRNFKLLSDLSLPISFASGQLQYPRPLRRRPLRQPRPVTVLPVLPPRLHRRPNRSPPRSMSAAPLGSGRHSRRRCKSRAQSLNTWVSAYPPHKIPPTANIFFPRLTPKNPTPQT